MTPRRFRPLRLPCLALILAGAVLAGGGGSLAAEGAGATDGDAGFPPAAPASRVAAGSAPVSEAEAKQPGRGESLLRCEWTDPVTGGTLRAALPSPALLVLPPGGRATVGAETTDGTPLRLRAADGGRLAESVALVAPTAPGPHAFALRVAGTDRQAEQAGEIVLYVPHRARFSSGDYGNCTVGGDSLGRYRNPTASGVEKIRAHPERYAPPEWFVRIDPGLSEHCITPTLRLGDLVIPDRETGERHSAWAPVRYDCLLAIERLREELAAQGIPPGALRLLSLFRAPRYNRRIGSGSYSRHIYGDALDFIIDADGDGDMDDLTGDGRVDRREAFWLIALVEDLQADGEIPIGGIGAYTFAAGDFSCTMHLDLRGHRARWAFHHGAGGGRREFSWESRRFREQDAAEEAARTGKP